MLMWYEVIEFVVEMGRIWWKLCIFWKGFGNFYIYIVFCEFGGRDRGKISGKDFVLLVNKKKYWWKICLVLLNFEWR